MLVNINVLVLQISQEIIDHIYLQNRKQIGNATRLGMLDPQFH